MKNAVIASVDDEQASEITMDWIMQYFEYYGEGNVDGKDSCIFVHTFSDQKDSDEYYWVTNSSPRQVW